jgi:hypothetical protein
MTTDTAIAIPLWMIVMALIAWTSIVAGVLMWMNNRFNSLLPADIYVTRHSALEKEMRDSIAGVEKRLRKLEMWAATKSFYESTGRESEE